MKDLLSELRWRGFLAQTTSEDIGDYLSEPRSIYIGFDPSAASLHLGNLLAIMGLAHAQRCGHRPIALVGGGTGLIGDPSGKSAERNLLTREQVTSNCEGIREQLSRVIDLSYPDRGVLLNNADWLCSLNLLEFLRDTGKYFSVNEMVKRDSVRIRLEERDQGISYTEFSYMLLQAFDFRYLCEHHNCTVQMGGSDQWGNIVSGKDLIRRVLHKRAEGITFPLLTTSSGKKFGKTEEGAVWLDANLTSPYKMYQHWIQAADAEVVAYLKLFTFLDQDEIGALEHAVAIQPEGRLAQKTLAAECTAIVHGKQTVRAIEEVSAILFGSVLSSPDPASLRLLSLEMPTSSLAHSELEQGVAPIDLLVRSGLAESKGAARKLVEGGGFSVYNKRVGIEKKLLTTADLEWPSALLIRAGKKNYHLIQVS